MGLFQTIGDLANPKLKKRQWQYQKAQATKAIADVVRAREFRKLEDPREQAHLKQRAFARGLGKSSIEQQDRGRLTLMQDQRNKSLAEAEDVARKYYRYLRKAKKHAQTSAWLGLLDGVISLAAGAGMGASPSNQYGGMQGGDYGAYAGSFQSNYNSALAGGDMGSYFGQGW